MHRAPPFPPGAARSSGSSEGRSGETPGAETLWGGGGSVVLETASAGRRLPLLCGGDSSSCPEPSRAQFLGPDSPGWALSHHPTGNPRGGGAQGGSAERRGKRVPAPEVPVGRGGRWSGRVSLVTPGSRGSLRFPVPSHHREASPSWCMESRCL